MASGTSPKAITRWLPVCVILLLQAAAARVLIVPERSLPTPDLHRLPLQLGTWKAPAEESIEEDVARYLKPDDYILRSYADQSTGANIGLFVAYFKSMQNSEGPHSPRVCLPSAGWLVRSSEILPLPVPGPSGTIPVNRYVMERSGDRILVVYWYQDTHDAWAEEFQAKLKLLNNLIRYRRSDVSLIRIITPVNRTTAGNEFATCVGFTRQMYPALVERFNATR